MIQTSDVTIEVTKELNYEKLESMIRLTFDLKTETLMNEGGGSHQKTTAGGSHFDPNLNLNKKISSGQGNFGQRLSCLP